MDPASLTLLVLRAQSGDRRALDEALRAVQPELHRYLTRMLGDAAGAEDALQESLLLIVRKLHHLREARFFRTWAYRIATREGLRASRPPRMDPTPPGAPSPPLEPDEIREILDRIDALPPNSRAVILLHYMAGMSLSAAAAVMDVPEGTAKSRLAYALSLLRRQSGAP